MIPSLLLVGSVLLAAPQAAPAQRPVVVQHLARVDVTQSDMAAFVSMDLDVVYLDLDAGYADVVATAPELAALDAAGRAYRVVTNDLRTWYAQRLAQAPVPSSITGSYGGWLAPPFSQGGMGGYYTLAEIESVLDQMRAAYPGLISARQSIGQSLFGRDIWFVRISDNADSDEGEPEVRIDSLHHAREPQGMQSSLWFMLFLLEEYGSDPLATYLVNEREIYFVPCVNPDGYEYNRQIAPGGGGLWRKNRRPNAGGTTGVDLNRNYPYEWGYDNNGSSPNGSSETYRGAGPASEPEVAAMVNFISAHQFTTALSVHTYSNLWLAPWGYDELFPPDWPEMQEIGDLATEVNGYEHGPASIVLYEANGVTIDYDYGVHGTCSWTPEIGSSSDGFWPAQSRIIPLAEDNLLAFYRTALAGGAWVRAIGVASVDAGDGDGSHESGELVELTATLRNTGKTASDLILLSLATSSPFAAVVNGQALAGPIASFTDGQNAPALSLAIAPGTPAGTIVPFTVTYSQGGWAQDLAGEIVVGTEVVLAAFDFEAPGDEGWSVGNPNDASTGEWERGDPIGTAAQPEDDHTPDPATTCWFTGQGSAGGSVGQNDVDGGSTTLVSPVFDLSNLAVPRVKYWRWYSNDEGGTPNEDVFRVDLSDDGGASWVPAETVGPTGAQSSGGWFPAMLDVSSILVPTSQMRVRFTASDLGGGSIVEAALDDVEVTYFEGSVCPAPANYCGTSPNSAGAGSLISWSGDTDVADDDFQLLVSGAVPNQFGLFFYGPGQGQFPIGNGVVCVSGGAKRLPVVSTDASGNAAHLVDFGNPPPGGVIQNGDTFNFQFWYRDPGVGAGFNFSDGLEVEFCAD